MVASPNSQSVLALIGDEASIAPEPSAPAKRWTPVFIVASPRPATGKTFLARLVADFLRADGTAVKAFDLSPGDATLTDFLPTLTSKAHLDSTQAQMALYDGLIVNDGVAKVVDLGAAAFERFFAVAEEIGFTEEARGKSVELLILFAADAHKASIQAYADLLKSFPDVILVPVFNEGVTKMPARRLRDHYPFSRAAAVPLQLPLLPPALKAHADKSAYSFADFHAQLPMAIPLGHAFELRSWTKRAFLEFRELELRLLLEKLRASLKS